MSSKFSLMLKLDNLRHKGANLTKQCKVGSLIEDGLQANNKEQNETNKRFVSYWVDKSMTR